MGIARPYHQTALVALGIVCVAVPSVLVAGAHAASSRRSAVNGLIVFQAHVGGFNQLFTIKPNGSGLRQVTRIRFSGDTDGAEQADWSPDGRTIAFDAPSVAGGDTVIDVFTVRRDGSGLSELPLAVPGFNGAPTYSPDGTRIAFDQDVGDSRPTVHGIFVAKADGSDPQRITTGIATRSAFDTNADWSPDGRRLSFTRVRNGREAAIFVVGADGHGLKRLTPWSLDAANADWSPDGSRLLFHTYYDEHAGKSSNIFTIRPGGGRMTPLTHFSGGGVVQAVGPSWSPDGTKIVWHEVSPTVDQLFIMDAHGGHVRKLTHLPADASPSRADWGTG
jgi:Tol biopolymer transport system component